jgi:hypothetical protein
LLLRGLLILLLLLGVRVCKIGPGIVFHCRIEIRRNLLWIMMWHRIFFRQLHVISSSFFCLNALFELLQSA